MQDSELLQLLRCDASQGMRALSAQYAGLLYSVVRSRLSASVFGSGEVEDIVADTLSAFYLTLDRYDPDRCSIRSYLCVMARNRAVDILRRSPVTTLPLDEEIGDGLDVADDAEEADLRARLIREVQALGEPDSAILIRKYYLGQGSKQIAADLGMTVSNVDTRTHRAIQKLKMIFRGENE